MDIRSKLPSAQFALMVVSLGLSAGLIYAAERFTNTHAAPAQVAVTQNSASPTDWQAALAAIQAGNIESAYQEPDKNAVSKLLAAAQSQNITDTVGRSIFVNLSSAKSQGLGDDIPTQEQIIAQAAAQLNTTGAPKTYKISDVVVVADSAVTLKAYGNQVIGVFNAHPEASVGDTFVAFDEAVEKSDTRAVQKLSALAKEYEALMQDLRKVAVPQRLAPLHLLMVNDFVRVTASYSDMAAVLADPLRGLAGLQNYQSYLNEAGRVFTQVAQNFNKEGIIFGKDEPGSAWSVFLLAPN